MNTAADIDTVLSIASDAGLLMLESGGETYRAEETMSAAAAALGGKSCEAFVTPTVVILSCTDFKGMHHCCMHRVVSRSVNLSRIGNIDKLTRRLVKPVSARDTDPAMIVSVLKRIRNSAVYKAPFVILAAALSSFFFALMFGGSLRDGIAAALCGAILRIVMNRFEKIDSNQFIQSLVGGIQIAVSCTLCRVVGLIESSEIASISTLMLLVPGLAIVNAIRDIIAGDLVAGSARMVEAFVIAAGISIGAALGVLIATSFFGALL